MPNQALQNRHQLKVLPLALVPVQDLVHDETLCEAFLNANLEQTSLASPVS